MGLESFFGGQTFNIFIVFFFIQFYDIKRFDFEMLFKS